MNLNCVWTVIRFKIPGVTALHLRMRSKAHLFPQAWITAAGMGPRASKTMYLPGWIPT
jgi:hypothetical protein